MKKVLSLILVLAMCLCLCACGSGEGTPSTEREATDPVVAEPVATIVTKDSETVNMTASELVAIYEENEAKYNTTYQGGKVTITGTVEKVEEHREYFGSYTPLVYVVKLKEGWEVTVLADKHEEVIDLAAGDTVRISSKLQGVGIFGDVEMQYIWSQGTTTFFDDTKIVKIG